jgi:hypothetical protein
MCQYANSNDCVLNDKEAISTNTMTELKGKIDTNEKKRTGVINHQPSACPYTSGCNYLITVYNTDTFGFVTVSLKLTSNN